MIVIIRIVAADALRAMPATAAATGSCPTGGPLGGDAEIAIEAKSNESPTSDHLRGLRAWKEEHPKSRCLLVSRVPRARTTEDGIEVLPVGVFLRRLWGGEI